MTVEVTDDGSDRATQEDTVTEGDQTICPKRCWPAVSIVACAEGLSHYANVGVSVGMWAFGHH